MIQGGLDRKSILNSELRFYIQKGLCDQVIKMGQAEGFPDGELRFKAYSLIFENDKEQILESSIGNVSKSDSLKIQKIMLSDIDRSIAVNSLMFQQSLESQERLKLRTKTLLLQFFDQNKHFSYYQGFNSVAEVVVANFEDEHCLVVLEGLASRLLSGFLNSYTFEQSVLSFNETTARVVRRITGIKLEP
jgi:hypothetical protein